MAPGEELAVPGSTANLGGGFDTLAVRVWIWAEEGFYIQAAPAAFLLILAAVIPLSFLLKREQIFK